ncbi:MAG TPA: EAL domain-containing protein [Nevskia sp.]|jgi:diguanylate cyclase (GGDEF)-like protein|nr:EAL domain-containing protein [Nevskia sp.]
MSAEAASRPAARPRLRLFPLARRLSTLPIPFKLAAVVVSFTLAFGVLMILMQSALELNGSVRAYVQGEGLWSKGQKDATYHLVRYLQSRDSRDYALYEQSVALPLSDREARLEMDKPDYDREVAARNFLRGGNAPEDVPGMIDLYRRYGHMRFFADAIDIWAKADTDLLELDRHARTIRAAIVAGEPPARQEELLQRLDQINAELTRMEEAFSVSFGEGAHLVQRLLTSLVLMSGLGLLAIGLALSWWVTSGIRAGIERLRRGALRISEGDLDSRIEVRGGDELGELATVFNDMMRRRREAEAQILHNAHHDALTGLPNRTLLLDRLEMAMRLARRSGNRVALLLLDLDHFKRVNDTLGHLVGDGLLLAVSRQLQTCVRDVDTVARLGGDEFVVVLSEVGGTDELQPVLDKIAQAVATPVTVDGHELVITPSIGGCLYPADGADTTTLLKHADVAMYHAKASGRGTMQWFSGSMLEETREKLALGFALRRAVDQGELSVHYQPQVSLRSGRVIGMEALLRWRHPEHGDISPCRFIAVAEETGQILSLGDWVLRRACLDCARMQRSTGRPLMLAVNVSPRQFRQPDLVGTVQRALRDGGLRPEHLELEITESLLMDNPDANAAVLRRLRALGVTVAIDDFGTGYSSLSYLTRFPIDKIKIDHSFVRDLATDSTDAAVINAIIAMAHSLNIRVIAEGVENDAQKHYLDQRGCDEAQGFLYSAAVPADRFAALFA